MGGVALLVAIPLTVILRGRASDGTAVPESVTVPAVRDATVDAQLGVRYQLPKGWTQRKRAGTIDLRSGDRATGVTITAPAPAGQVRGVLHDALSSLRAHSKKAAVIERLPDQRLGGLSGQGLLMDVVNSHDTKVRTLLVAVSGRNRTYLVQSFTAGYGQGEPLTQGQVLLNGLSLTG
jgi:hypothetical protein